MTEDPHFTAYRREFEPGGFDPDGAGMDGSDCPRPVTITGACLLGAFLIVVGALAWAGAGAVLG